MLISNFMFMHTDDIKMKVTLVFGITNNIRISSIQLSNASLASILNKCYLSHFLDKKIIPKLLYFYVCVHLRIIY